MFLTFSGNISGECPALRRTEHKAGSHSQSEDFVVKYFSRLVIFSSAECVPCIVALKHVAIKIQCSNQITVICHHVNNEIDMVVAARALAELRLVSVFALIPPTTTHPPPPTHPNWTKLFLSSLWSDLSMWGHFLIVLNLRNPNLRPAHKNFVQQCTLRHL